MEAWICKPASYLDQVFNELQVPDSPILSSTLHFWLYRINHSWPNKLNTGEHKQNARSLIYAIIMDTME